MWKFIFYGIKIELNFNIFTPNWYQGKELISVKNNLDKFVNYTVLEKFCSYYLKDYTKAKVTCFFNNTMKRNSLLF